MKTFIYDDLYIIIMTPNKIESILSENKVEENLTEVGKEMMIILDVYVEKVCELCVIKDCPWDNTLDCFKANLEAIR